MSIRAMWLCAAAAVICIGTAGQVKAAEHPTIALEPDMPAIELEKVPGLDVTAMDDASLTDDPLAIDPEQPYRWIVSPGERMIIDVGARDSERGDVAVLTVWDWENRPVAQRRFDVPFAERVAFEVTGRGTYLLTLDRFDGERCVSRLVRNFAVSPDNRDKRAVWNEGEFFIGADMKPGRQHWRSPSAPAYLPELGLEETAALEADLNVRLGIQVARLNPHEWGVELYHERRFLLHIKPWPIWEAEVAARYRDQMPELGDDWRLPREESGVKATFEEVADQWAAEAFFIQLGNEPDTEAFWLGTAGEYVQRYNWGYEIFKRAAPQTPITAGGYTAILEDRLQVYVNELRDVTDWVSFHTHGPLLRCIEKYQRIAALHKEARYENPVYVNTEMGSRAWRLDRDRHQAIDAVQKTLYFWSRRHRGVSLYKSRDIVVGPRRVDDSGWGYLDYYMCPRFAYGAIGALIDLYAGARFERALHGDEDLQVYEFTRGDTTLIAAFRPQDRAAPITLRGDTPARRKIDAMGNASPLNRNRITVEVGAYPVTVEWPAGTNVTLD